jgi:hypothetical protein
MLAVDGFSLATGTLLLAVSLEKRAEALCLAGKYELLNANGGGNKGDVLSAEHLLELHRDEEQT